MADKPESSSTDARMAGAGTGTVLASLISLMDDGTWKSILLILAPSIAIAVAASWGFVVSYINDVLADWKIRNQLSRAQKLLERLKNEHSSDSEIVKDAEENVNALKILELNLSKKRIQAVLDQEAI